MNTWENDCTAGPRATSFNCPYCDRKDIPIWKGLPAGKFLYWMMCCRCAAILRRFGLVYKSAFTDFWVIAPCTNRQRWREKVLTYKFDKAKHNILNRNITWQKH